MHGSMSGFYEIRLSGPRREQFRLFCLLENGSSEELARRGLQRPAIAVILDHPGVGRAWLLIVLVSVFDSHVRFPCG
jgi:hypothetical protein